MHYNSDSEKYENISKHIKMVARLRCPHTELYRHDTYTAIHSIKTQMEIDVHGLGYFSMTINAFITHVLLDV